MARILITFATRKGSTSEIAGAIGKELQAAGHTVEVLEMKTVSSLTGYNAVVIGGPMYMGRMVGDVPVFVKRHRDTLRKLPIAGFIVGLAAVSKDLAGLTMAEKALGNALTPLQPVTTAVFAGRLDMAKLSWFQRWITKKVHSPTGDFRDWNAIAAWARDLTGKLGL